MVFVLIIVSLGIVSCSLFGTKGRVPPNATLGMIPNSIKILGHFQLSDWASGVTDSEYLSVFSGKLTTTGDTELRVFYDNGENTTYVGALTESLGTSKIKTIFVNLGKDRCIIGWVSPEIPGKLLHIRFGRVKTEITGWLEAQKESTIERNMFIIPIASEEADLWNSLSEVTVQTQDTLDRGYDGLGSYYALEKYFEPPLDVSSYYNNIFIQP